MTEKTKKLRANEVFTPGSFPTHTYVQRQEDLLEQRLRDGLETKGQIISVSGPSKSGKTVLVERVVGREALITLTGAGIRDPEDIWARVLDWMATPDEMSATDADSEAVTVEAKAKATVGFMGTGAELGASVGDQKTTQKTISVVTRRRGLSQVVREIADSDFVVLLDDFHYMPRDVQVESVKQLKEAARLGVKICTASVPHRSDDVVRANPELRGRVLALDLGYWNEADLRQIARLGFAKLNADLDGASLSQFVAETAGSPQLMQAICLQTCFGSDLREEAGNPRSLKFSSAERTNILEATSSVSDFRSLVEVLEGGPKTRGTERKTYKFADGGEGDVYRCILRAIAADPPQLSFDYDEITKRVGSLCRGEAPVGSSIIGSCEQMNKLAGEKFPTERVIEWDDQKQVFDVTDPYLIFYLRWSGLLKRD